MHRVGTQNCVGCNCCGCVTLGMSFSFSELWVSSPVTWCTNDCTIGLFREEACTVPVLSKCELLLLMPKKGLALNCQVSWENST